MLRSVRELKEKLAIKKDSPPQPESVFDRYAQEDLIKKAREVGRN